MTSNFEVELVNDSIREFNVTFHGPADSELLYLLPTLALWLMLLDRVMKRFTVAAFGRYTSSYRNNTLTKALVLAS
jgi:hypothetical protein